jgi:hypothetical protein
MTGTPYPRPSSRRQLAVAGAVASAVGWLRRRRSPLGAGTLMSEARRQTGLADFGDQSFVEPLTTLLGLIEQEPLLTPLGRLMLRTAMLNKLKVRLRAEALFRRHPEIAAEEIAAPIFITGLTRSGTSMLQRLMAADPGLRSLPFWEAFNPAPLPRRRWQRQDPRLRAAAVTIEAMQRLMPELLLMHPMAVHMPEEELFLLELSFREAPPLRAPALVRWVDAQDQTPSYSYLRRMLQLMQWQRRRERWLLKCPVHLPRLPTLTTVFPDARVIWTHRDPTRCLASACSLFARQNSYYVKEVDAGEVGASVTERFRGRLDRAMDFRDGAGAGRIKDVSYYALMDDPMREISSIYEFLGRELRPETISCMKRWLNDHPQGKNGTHQYRLQDFGIQPQSVEPHFARYRARLQIRRE